MINGAKMKFAAKFTKTSSTGIFLDAQAKNVGCLRPSSLHRQIINNHGIDSTRSTGLDLLQKKIELPELSQCRKMIENTNIAFLSHNISARLWLRWRRATVGRELNITANTHRSALRGGNSIYETSDDI